VFASDRVSPVRSLLLSCCLAIGVSGQDPAVSAIRKEFENGQLRILRVVCAARQACPASQNPDDPAITTILTGPDKVPFAGRQKRSEAPWKKSGLNLKHRPLHPMVPDKSRSL
jgi:hypothetical protein